MKRLLPLLAAGLLLAGCSTTPPTHKPVPKIAAPPAPREQLLRTDAEFSAMSKARGMAVAFHHFAAPDATILPMGQQPVRGRERIRASILESGDGTLTWTPRAAEVAQSGELGYTWGTYEFHGKDAEGNPRVSHGKYISIWKKQADGVWRYILDGGNTNPPPE